MLLKGCMFVFVILLPIISGIRTPPIIDSSSVVLSPSLSFSLRSEYKEFSALLGTVFSELTSTASSIVASDHFQTIQSTLLQHVGPTTGKFLIRWGFLLYISYSTTHIVHDIYMYKSILEDTGYKLHQYEEEFFTLTNQCHELVDQLTKLSEAICDEEYYVFVDDFRSTFQRINDTISRMKTEIAESLVLLEEEESFHLLQQKRTFVNGLGTCVYTLGSIMLTAVYPPSLPWLVASKASSVLGLGLSSWNFFTSYVEGKNVEKVKYRIRRFLEVSDRIEERRNVTEKLLERFEVEVEEYSKRKESMNGLDLVIAKFVKWWKRSQKQVINYLGQVFGEDFRVEIWIGNVCYYALLCGWVVFLVNIFRASPETANMTLGMDRADPVGKGRPGSFWKRLKVMIILILLFYLFSLFIGIQIEETNKLREKVQTNEVEKDQWEERYRKECVWWELSIKTQLYYEFKSVFYEFIPFLEDKGIQELTMNENGELLQMYHCKMLKKKIEMFKKNEGLSGSSQHGVINTKMDSIFELFRNIFRNTFGMIGEGIEMFREKTSFTSKLWLISVGAIFVILYFKR